MVQQLFCDSRDRISGTSTNFSIQLNTTLVLEGGAHKMRIDNLRLPIVVPTIQTGVNDTLVVLEGATHYTITIPQANYDGPDLAAKLQALLFAACPGAWTVAYDVNNIAMKISCTNNFTFTGGTYFAQLTSHPYTSTANSYSFTYVTVLGLDMCYISSSRFANVDTFGPNGSHDTIMSINITTPFGGVQESSMPWDVWVNVPAMTAQQLDFQLRDRNYNILTIVPNISFTVSID
jgi:hypothetical protein